MSLIRVRRNRKKNWLDAKRPNSRTTRRWTLAFLLAVALIWYLSYTF